MARVAEGVRLHRVYGEARAPRWYGRRDATSRWDDPEGDFGVLYLGRSPIGAFAETLLRTPTDRDVLWTRVQQKRQATFKVLAPLRLAKLHGEGLAWFGVTAAEIAEADYALPQGLARRVHTTLPPMGFNTVPASTMTNFAWPCSTAPTPSSTWWRRALPSTSSGPARVLRDAVID
jgi:hypothetical protein